MTDYGNAKVTHLQIGNAKVTVIDPCVTEEQQKERRERIEQAMIRFYKQAMIDRRKYYERNNSN